MNSASSEMSDVSVYCNALALHGIIGYDASCGVCCALITKCGESMTSNGLLPVSLQTDILRRHLESTWPDGIPQQMIFVNSAGECVGGAEAILAIAPHFWWACWLPWVVRVPGLRDAMSKGYRWVASHRYCLAGRCQVSTPAPKAVSARWAAWMSTAILASLVLTRRAR